MKDKELLNLWKRGDDLMKNGQISSIQIEKFLKPRINRFSVFLRTQLITYLLAQAASIILLSVNVFGYRGNLVMQAISSALIGICVVFLFIGRGMWKQFGRISRQNGDLFGLLKEKIVFFRYKFERWNLVAAVTLWILVFALGAYIDNDGGVFRINKPFFFGFISLSMMVFIYFGNKFTAEGILRETRACLNELENAWDGSGETLERIRRRQKVIFLVLILILTVSMIIGLLVFLNRG